MTTTGLRELRQNASELVRQAEAGEIVVVTVSGREVAELGPVRRDQWRSWTYGRLAAAVGAAGRAPRARATDLLVAATAVAHGARLYTRNAEDLRGLEDLVDVVALR